MTFVAAINSDKKRIQMNYWRNTYHSVENNNCIWLLIVMLEFVGKTAAFMLPILERLLYRPTHLRISRVLILLPTRELAIQVFRCW